MPGRKEIEVRVVVNGRPVEVKVNVGNHVSRLIEEALRKSGNSGQPASNWECETVVVLSSILRAKSKTTISSKVPHCS